MVDAGDIRRDCPGCRARRAAVACARPDGVGATLGDGVGGRVASRQRGGGTAGIFGDCRVFVHRLGVRWFAAARYAGVFLEAVACNVRVFGCVDGGVRAERVAADGVAGYLVFRGLLGH